MEKDHWQRLQGKCCKYNIDSITHILFYPEFTYSGILNLNKTVGHDNLSPYFLIEASNIVFPAL